jgi:hypothetical protein
MVTKWRQEIIWIARANPITGLDRPCAKQSAHEDGTYISPIHRRLYPQELYLVLISVRG